MNDELNQTLGSKSTDDLKAILITSLLGTIGVMWTIGGILAILHLYDVNWILGWLSAFIWIWGCWAAALYFDVKRFIM
jgi:TctA family transporter